MDAELRALAAKMQDTYKATEEEVQLLLDAAVLIETLERALGKISLRGDIKALRTAPRSGL
jgi:hypothetical protein